MTTYQSVRAQIAKLEKQAETLRRQELKNVIAQVREVIAQYGLSAADLGLAGARRGKAKAGKTARRASAGVAKYRDPQSGQTWTGHGRPPAWIVSAKDRNAFLIGDAVAPAKAAKQAKAKTAKAAKAVKAMKAAKPAAKASAKTRAAARAKKARAAAKSGAVQIESGVAAQ